ncbi:MAG: hypothetical protein DSY37_03845 [Hyperthermus sp.]|nr:MAG: hypothetical protein DSY37_03845 [Hyperthermus sp.]
MRSARHETSASNTSLQDGAELRIIELYESLQGEGPFCCRRSVFLRLAGCNLRCPFCDTPQALSMEEGEPVKAEELVERVRESSREAGMLVVTGGEPLIQRAALNRFIELLWSRSPYMDVQVETNGTLPAPSLGEILFEAFFVVSPKNLPVSVQGARLHDSWLRFAKLTRRAWFKFLVRGESDVGLVERWVEQQEVPRELVYLMPLTLRGWGVDRLLEVHRRVARLAVDKGFNFSPRMHLLLELP